LENIDSLVALDRYALDVEAERSAANLQTYGQMHAAARADKDEAEAELKRAYAIAELRVRQSDPHEFGLGKFTEDSVTACVESSKEVEDAVKKSLKVRKELYELEATVSALNDKSSQIKNLVSLWIGGYFAEPGKKTSKY
jgi:hypothetical protein